MHLVNFSHPLTEDSVKFLEANIAQGTRLIVVNVPVQLSFAARLPNQIYKIIDDMLPLVGGNILNVDVYIPPDHAVAATIIRQVLPRSSSVLVLAPTGLPPRYVPNQLIREYDTLYWGNNEG